MKMAIHHEAPVKQQDYEGLASVLRTTFDGKPVVDKKCCKQILESDPKFAAWFEKNDSLFLFWSLS
jgi:hypothetical protein